MYKEPENRSKFGIGSILPTEAQSYDDEVKEDEDEEDADKGECRGRGGEGIGALRRSSYGGCTKERVRTQHVSNARTNL